MATAPPIARDRLIGLAGVQPGLIKVMEEQQRIPPKLSAAAIDDQLLKVCDVIAQLLDIDIFPWLASGQPPAQVEVERAATIVADRLCGSQANPIIRNEQERRQLRTIKVWLEARGYSQLPSGSAASLTSMPAGTFAFHLNVPARLASGPGQVNIPIDVVIMPHQATIGMLPLLVEAKSAGDFTNTNKRRKEEATKFVQLRKTYGADVQFILFLCGYFDSGYLGYEAAEGIDWLWEHRIDDLSMFGV